MKISKVERYEEAHVILYEGKDFKKSSLERMNEGVYRMPLSYGDELARKHGYDHMYWTGIYGHRTHSIEVVFRKKLH